MFICLYIVKLPFGATGKKRLKLPVCHTGEKTSCPACGCSCSHMLFFFTVKLLGTFGDDEHSARCLPQRGSLKRPAGAKRHSRRVGYSRSEGCLVLASHTGAERHRPK